ncbi:hypothetical protein R1sor_010695 [Riccia sorocarpa]|uniref:Uncharacterized protein n=1 Tax=Riccia sorocarpa TaxID=122646 RepID=A0ABD3I4V0_9MARC
MPGSTQVLPKPTHECQQILDAMILLQDMGIVKRADRAELIAELDKTRLAAEPRDAETIVDNYIHDDTPPAHPEGAVQPEVQIEPEVQGNVGSPLTATLELAAALRQFTELQAKGVDLKIVVMRDNKVMWPPGKHEEWNRISVVNDLPAIRRFFPIWAPLLETYGVLVEADGAYDVMWHLPGSISLEDVGLATGVLQYRGTVCARASQLEGGTANPSQTLRHANDPAPAPMVLSDDDEDDEVPQ